MRMALRTWATRWLTRASSREACVWTPARHVFVPILSRKSAGRLPRSNVGKRAAHARKHRILPQILGKAEAAGSKSSRQPRRATDALYLLAGHPDQWPASWHALSPPAAAARRHTRADRAVFTAWFHGGNGTDAARGRRRTRSFARKRDPEHGRCELSVKQNGLSSLVAFGAFGRGESAPACRAFPAIT
jgi:hypothetical protein